MRDYGAEAGARRDYSGGLTALQCSTERGYGAEAGAWRDYSGGLAALQCGMSFLKVAGAKSHGTKKRPIRHNKKIFTAFSLTPREIPKNVFFRSIRQVAVYAWPLLVRMVVFLNVELSTISSDR